MTGCSALDKQQTTIDIHNKIHGYCLADFNGNRLQLNPNIKEYVSWEEESGWDHFTIINDFKIDSINVTGLSATAIVQYTVTAYVDGVTLTKQQSQQELITFNLSKTKFGWRIDSPVIAPHVSLEKAKKLLSKAIYN